MEKDYKIKANNWISAVLTRQSAERDFLKKIRELSLNGVEREELEVYYLMLKSGLENKNLTDWYKFLKKCFKNETIKIQYLKTADKKYFMGKYGGRKASIFKVLIKAGLLIEKPPKPLKRRSGRPSKIVTPVKEILEDLENEMSLNNTLSGLNFYLYGVQEGKGIFSNYLGGGIYFKELEDLENESKLMNGILELILSKVTYKEIEGLFNLNYSDGGQKNEK